MIQTSNVKADMPSLKDARRSVIEEIRVAKRRKVRVLKVIHGWGSTGKGGTLCVGLRKSFKLRKKEGVIRDFIPGEHFSIFNKIVLEVAGSDPEASSALSQQALNESIVDDAVPTWFREKSGWFVG